jgi:hypothetical protein
MRCRDHILKLGIALLLGFCVLLRFPRARLHVYNRLFANGCDCVQGFSEVAREFGLPSPADLTEIRRELEGGICGSLATAHNILLTAMPDHGDELWKRLNSDIEQYRVKSNLIHCRTNEEVSGALSCGSMAAAVMDFLLQTIEPYTGNPSKWKHF